MEKKKENPKPKKREPYRSKKDGLTKNERILETGGATYKKQQFF